MKAVSLLLLRVSTALLIIIWAYRKVADPSAGIGLSDKYYGGIVSAEALQIPFGVFQIIIATLVILGLCRKFAYPLQFLILGFGALMIWKHFLMPFGIELTEPLPYSTLFFPSLGIAAGTLVTWMFMDDDHLSLDAKIAKRKL